MAQQTGGLGGLGGFFQRPAVQDTLDAVFTSMISSPRNNWLANFGPAYNAAQDRRALMGEQAAMQEALVAAGLSPEQAKVMAVNPQAAKLRLDMMERQREMEMQAQQRGQTYDFFSQHDPELAQMMDAGLPASDAFRIYTQKRQGPGGTEYGLTPVYGTDEATGDTVLGVVGKDGTFKKLDTGGFQVASGIEKVDLGTQWALYDKRTGQLVGYEPKDLRGAEREKAGGAAEGAADAEYESIKSKMPGLEAVVAQLGQLADEATYTLGGQLVDWTRAQTGGVPRDAAIARTKYISIVDNQILPLLRDTFGAQFTAAEGDRLRETLGDANKTPQEKQAVLRAFIEQKRRDVEALAVRTGRSTPSAPSKPISEMSDAELEAIVNGN
jgi:hypothetical protein